MTRRIRLRERSRYLATPLLSDPYNKAVPYFGVWERFEFPASPRDVVVRVTRAYNNRLDKLAHEYYGDSSLWWVIADANNVDDPLNIAIDTELRIPDMRIVVAALGNAVVNK